jgi:hypothetical protein
MQLVPSWFCHGGRVWQFAMQLRTANHTGWKRDDHFMTDSAMPFENTRAAALF